MRQACVRGESDQEHAKGQFSEGGGGTEAYCVCEERMQGLFKILEERDLGSKGMLVKQIEWAIRGGC